MGIIQKGSFKEVDIEDFIWDGIKNGETRLRGIELSSDMYYRQFKVPGAGVADIVGLRIFKALSDDGEPVKVAQVEIYELKRGAIVCDNVGQVTRYRQAIYDQFYVLQEALGVSGYVPSIFCALIGSSIDRDAAVLCHQAGVIAYTFDFCWKSGLVFTKYEDRYMFLGGEEEARVNDRIMKRDFMKLAKGGIRRMREVMDKNNEIPF